MFDLLILACMLPCLYLAMGFPIPKGEPKGTRKPWKAMDEATRRRVLACVATAIYPARCQDDCPTV